MTVPTFASYVSEALQHGEAEHAALIQTHNFDAEDAPDHDTEAAERLPLVQHHAEAVGAHYNAQAAYTKSSNMLNEALIKKQALRPGDQQTHNELNAMHEKAAPLMHDHHVYSSLGRFDPTEHIQKSGGVFNTPAHTSATINPHIASAHANFAKMSGDVKHSHLMHFHLPAGSSHGTYLGNHSYYPIEQEFLIKPNSTFKVDSNETHELPNGTKRTIWHVKPHDGSVHESSEFDVTSLRRTSGHKKNDRGFKYQMHLSDSRTSAEKDVNDQHDRLKEHGAKWLDGEVYNPKDTHTHALAKYSAESIGVNAALIRDKTNDSRKKMTFHKENMEHAEAVSAAIKHHAKPLPEDVHVYSGISPAHAVHMVMNSDKSPIHTPAFTSTSLSAERAMNFARPVGDSVSGRAAGRHRTTTDRHVLHFHLPKGYDKGTYVGNISHAPSEREMLLDKDQHWKVTGKKVVTDSSAWGMGSSDGGGRQSYRTHVWSLTPHDHNVHEAFEHDTNALRSYTSTKVIGYDKYDNEEHGTSTPKVKLHNQMTDGWRDHAEARGKEHCDHLCKTAPNPKTDATTYSDERGWHDDPEIVKINKMVEPLKDYTSSSQSMNKHLVDEHKRVTGGATSLENATWDHEHHDACAKKAAAVSSCIKHHAVALDRDGHFYSGMKHTSLAEASKTDHKLVHMPAFTSTSTSLTAAQNFIESTARVNAPKIRDSHIAHFKLPAGYKAGVHVQKISSHKSEHEYILDKGQTWKITGHERVTSTNKSAYTSGQRKMHTHVWTLEPHSHHPDKTSDKLTESTNLIKTFTAHSRDINSALNAGSITPAIQDKVTKLTNGMTEHSGEAATVYHGTKNRGFVHNAPYTPKGFLSASGSEETGRKFALAHGYESAQRGNIPEAHLIKLRVQPGTRTLNIPNEHSFYDEHETVVDRNQPLHMEYSHSEPVEHSGKSIVLHHWNATTAPTVHEATEHRDTFFNGSVTYAKVHGRTGVIAHTGKTGMFSTVNHADAHAEIQKQHSSMRNSHKIVDSTTSAIVHRYTAHSMKINEHLIKPNGISFAGGQNTHHANALTEAIRKHGKPLRHDVHVYSGLGEFNPTKHFDRTGTIHLPAFTSTSLSPTTALAFAPKNFKRDTSHIIHFHLPKGYKKSLYVAGHSAVKDEREMVLDRGQHWQLTGVKSSKVKIGYHNMDHEDHHRHVTVWSVRPHHSQLNEDLTHDVTQMHDAHPEGKSFQQQDAETLHSVGSVSHGHAALSHYADLTNAKKGYQDHIQAERDHLIGESEAHQRTHHPDVTMVYRETSNLKQDGYGSKHVNKHLYDYSEESQSVNQHLISKHSTGTGSPYAEQHEKTAERLSAAIAQHAAPLTQTHHVYSGLKEFDPTEHFEKGNGVIHTPAFTSASINPHVAKSFQASRVMDQHVLHFELPRGYTKGSFIGHHSEYPHEDEFLLDKGQSWKIKGKETVKTHDKQWAEGHIINRHIWTVTPHEDK